jgi:hypothetical protein
MVAVPPVDALPPIVVEPVGTANPVAAPPLERVVPSDSFDPNALPGFDEESRVVRPQLGMVVIQANPTRKRHAKPMTSDQ